MKRKSQYSAEEWGSILVRRRAAYNVWAKTPRGRSIRASYQRARREAMTPEEKESENKKSRERYHRNGGTRYVRKSKDIWSTSSSVNGVPLIMHAMRTYLLLADEEVAFRNQSCGISYKTLVTCSASIVRGDFFSSTQRLRYKKLWLRKYEEELACLAKTVLAVYVLRKARNVACGVVRLWNHENKRYTPTLLRSRVEELRKCLTILNP